MTAFSLLQKIQSWQCGDTTSKAKKNTNVVEKQQLRGGQGRISHPVASDQANARGRARYEFEHAHNRRD